jgi:thymidylate kinase
MIVELYGPPGVGKTTFADALAAFVRDCGDVVVVKSSRRPAEGATSANFLTRGIKCPHFIKRLSRPAIDIMTLVRHPASTLRHARTAARLIRLLPPTGVFSFVKHCQYLLRLTHAWNEKLSAGQLVLFDQGFTQAICSLTVDARAVDDRLIANAINCAPKADIVIRLDAPSHLLETRLNSRRQAQSAIERSLERDLTESLAMGPVVLRVHELMLNQGRCVYCASSLDPESLDSSVKLIGPKLLERLRTEHRGDER